MPDAAAFKPPQASEDYGGKHDPSIDPRLSSSALGRLELLYVGTEFQCIRFACLDFIELLLSAVVSLLLLVLPLEFGLSLLLGS